MSKLDELRRAAGANVAESMSKGLVRPAPMHGATAPAAAGPDRWAGLERLPGAQRVPIDRIIRDETQPREVFDEAELAELAASIRARGILQPIRVRWDEGRGMYVVIAGERRLRAARMAGRSDVPCVVHDGPLSEADRLLDQLAENVIRLDLQPIEQARAFKRLMDANGWSARRLADELHIDHDKVSRAVRLLVLPEDVQLAVEAGHLAPSTATVLAGVDDDATCRELAGRAVAGELTRDQVAEQVRAVSSRPAGGKGRGAKARARKVTSRTLRTSGGYRITVEHRRGVDDEELAVALQEAADRIKAELQDRGEAAWPGMRSRDDAAPGGDLEGRADRCRSY